MYLVQAWQGNVNATVMCVVAVGDPRTTSDVVQLGAPRQGFVRRLSTRPHIDRKSPIVDQLGPGAQLPGRPGWVSTDNKKAAWGSPGGEDIRPSDLMKRDLSRGCSESDTADALVYRERSTSSHRQASSSRQGPRGPQRLARSCRRSRSPGAAEKSESRRSPEEIGRAHV